MQAFNIFLHAIRMVFGNFGTVQRIGGVALVVSVLYNISMGETAFAPQTPVAPGGLPELPPPLTLALTPVYLIVALWTVVAWHRYILLEEEPGALAPRWNGSAIWSYVVAGFFYSLTLIAAAIPLGIVVGLIAFAVFAGNGQGSILLAVISGLLVYVPIIWLAYRLSPMLPGAAIERRLRLGEAWSATSDASGGSFVLLGVLTVAAGWVLNLPAAILAEASVLVANLWVGVVSWIMLMVGASVLTTIYGVHVEKRALNV